jgi:hypothetical protein
MDEKMNQDSMTPEEFNGRCKLLGKTDDPQELFHQLIARIPFKVEKGEEVARYGYVYTQEGDSQEKPILAIETFLEDLIEQVRVKITKPINSVKCYLRKDSQSIEPRLGPSGMVAILSVGQERTLKVGGSVPSNYIAIRGDRQRIDAHTPKDNFVLNSGSLLLIDDKILYSMARFDNDDNFNRRQCLSMLWLVFRNINPGRP